MPEFHALKVRALRKETRDATAVTLEIPQTLRPVFRFQPGQYLTFRARLDAQELRRNYSICSTPQDPQLTVAVKRVPEGRFSNWVNDQLRVGDVLEVMPPAGRFVRVPARAAGHYLAIAAGSGITPILSILRSTLSQEPDSRFTLVYGNRAAHAVMFREAIEDLKNLHMSRFSLFHVLSREPQEVEAFNGRIDVAKCRVLFSDWISAMKMDAVYLCGPQSMMQDATTALQEAGVAPDRIQRELFVTADAPDLRPRPVTDSAAAAQCAVTVIQDGRARAFNMPRAGQSILRAALAQGIELPWSCQGGVCSTCRCKLVEGEVEMDTNYALEDYEIRRGFRLACQSYPLSDRIVIDYDQQT